MSTITATIRRASPSRFWKDRRATSAVEFAIVFPMFMVVLFGILIYGSYLAVVHGVQQLAAEAARSSIAGLSDTERASLAQSYITSNVSYYVLISPSLLTVNAAASPTNSNVFVVTVSYDDSSSYIYALPNVVPMPSSTIVASAAIPRGGY
jgi:Flp pilus assembly protein TadG